MTWKVNSAFRCAAPAEKLWSMFVEPPWTYQVASELVELDVMGIKTQFPVRSGPGSARRPPAPDT